MTTTESNITSLSPEKKSDMLVSYLNETDETRREIIRKGHEAMGTSTAKKSRGMWGEVQQTISTGVGAKFVICSGHGGYLISRARQQAIEPELQKFSPAFFDGCGVYEEDCDARIYEAFFPRARQRTCPALKEDISTARLESVKYLVERYTAQVDKLLTRLVSEGKAAMPAA